ERVLDRLAPQCPRIILNANGDPARFAFTRLPVVPDEVPDFAGPLAGVLAGLDWAAHPAGTAWVVSVPGDRPFPPRRPGSPPSRPRALAARLPAARAADGRPLAGARWGEWRHPVVGLWPVALRDDLRHALLHEGLHKIEVWTARHGIAIAEWPATPVDPFFNVN